MCSAFLFLRRICYSHTMSSEGEKIRKEAREQWARLAPEQQEEKKKLLAALGEIDEKISDLQAHEEYLRLIAEDYGGAAKAEEDLKEARRQKESLLDHLVK